MRREYAIKVYSFCLLHYSQWLLSSDYQMMTKPFAGHLNYKGKVGLFHVYEHAYIYIYPFTHMYKYEFVTKNSSRKFSADGNILLAVLLFTCQSEKLSYISCLRQTWYLFVFCEPFCTEKFHQLQSGW